ncbi:uncharacterized protein YigA (DUF484 family) [Natronospira proteinivora]|uniref:Uncharacterized protein YigA (DUF484 family) n=1 Tax=Natronospira proteinivora TaxID=1807133 RepID=A0ABT1G9W4_9GAMM|nr:DUF484 family protein [Natronospira proteinivora]MCP1728119.1 uncharacterized protein YigA (DUF484 family) [Natronospira proteinivora]
MSTERKLGSQELQPEEQGVVDYLTAHPEFFDQHPELVSRLRVPHDSGDAVSLVEKQVAVLRQQNRQLERRLVDLVEVARSNDTLIDRMHHLALALVNAGDRQELLAGIDEVLRARFSADEVIICLFSEQHSDAGQLPARVVAPDDPGLSAFRNFLKNARPQLGRLSTEQLAFLFGDQAEGRVGSAALLPLGADARQGMIAIGNRTKDHFTANQGTVFLERMADLIATALARHDDRRHRR